MGAQLGNKGGFSDINMTPLIDIVLVVLIIMMVNIPIQIEQMGVKLPSQKKVETQPDQQADQLVIAVYDDGQIALNQRVMSEQKMVYELQRRIRNRTEKKVFIDAHADVEYGQVIDAVDLAYQANAVSVGLAKLKEEGPKPPTSVDPDSSMPRGLHFGSPLVATDGGDIDAKRADAAIQAIRPKLEACYAQRLANRPELTGQYTIETQVGPQGEHLAPPEVTSDTVKDLDLRDCIMDVLPSIPYGPLGEQKTAAVRYSVLFSPGQG